MSKQFTINNLEIMFNETPIKLGQSLNQKKFKNKKKSSNRLVLFEFIIYFKTPKRVNNEIFSN